MNSTLRRRAIALLGTLALIPMAAAPIASAASRQSTHARAATTIIWFMRIDPNENPWERAEAKAFEAANPNIHVNLILAPNPNGGFDTKFNTLIASGTPPDVWSHLGQAGFADYYHRNLLLNLSPLIKSTNYSFGSTPKNLINTYNIGGSIYGIPSITLGSYLFYNKDMFDAYNKAHPSAKIPYPPYNWDDKSWTWSKMVSEAKLLVNASKHQYGLVDTLWPPMARAWLAGTDFWPKSSYQTGLPKSANLMNPAYVSFIQEIADYSNPKKIGISPSYSEIKSIGNTGADPFQFGNIAIGLTGGWGFRSFRTVKFHWAAAAIPWRVGSLRDTLFTDPYMVYKGTKHPTEVFKFIQFLTNKQSMTSYIKNVGFTPSDPGSLGLWYSQYAAITGMPIEALQTLVAGARKYGFESPNHLIVNFSTLTNNFTQDTDPIFYGHKTAAQQLPVAQADINKLIANTK